MHAIIALIVQAICVAAGLSPWAGALVGIALYAGREHAQAEQRIIQNRYAGRRADAPWWAGFHPAAWNRAALIDLLAPAAATLAAALILAGQFPELPSPTGA